MFNQIVFNSSVTVSTPHGGRKTGKARLFNRQANVWVLNGGGRHGTPVIASPANVISVKGPKKS